MVIIQLENMGKIKNKLIYLLKSGLLTETIIYIIKNKNV